MKPIPRIAAVLAAIVLASCVSVPSGEAPVIAIVGGTVIHPDREPASAVEKNETLLIVGDRIRAMGPAALVRIPEGATVIDATGKWVIPGLIDSHVHFFQSGNIYTRPDAADFNAVVPYAQETARNKARLRATFKVWLASGVTSVVDIGGPFWNFDMRETAQLTAAAPRVVIAGPLISMVDDPKLDLGDPPIIKTTSPDEARALVARELVRKPDYIKVWFIHRPTDDVAAQEAIVKASGDAAHAAGVPLAVHATELVAAKAALRAGADYLVHSVEDAPVDDEFIALMKKNHAIYCPTLFVGNGYRYALSNTWKATDEEQRLADPQILATMHDLDKIPKDKIPTRVAKLMADPPKLAASPLFLANLRKVWAAGIPVAMGTDAGNIGTLHGPSIFREMEYMAESGLTPLQVLRSATYHGAMAMRMEADVGAIQQGRYADLVILDADPLADVKNLAKASLVMKGGVTYEPKALIDSIR